MRQVTQPTTPITQFIATMKDKLHITGLLGLAKPEHLRHLSTVRYERNLLAKTQPTTTFVASPLTGAQIEVRYWIEDHVGIPTAFVQIRIPLATATMSHNHIHAGLDAIPSEVRCAAVLAKVILAVLGFTREEVSTFMETTKTQLSELTWHTPTASPRARRSLQKRTKAHFERQREIRARHDIAVSDVDLREKNGQSGLLVDLKGGDAFRQYIKSEQAASRAKKPRENARIFGLAPQDRAQIAAEIENHVRNELLIGPNTLRQFNLEHPSSWTPEALKRVIDHLWAAIGLAPKRLDQSGTTLSPEVQATWERYLAGDDMRTVLPPHTLTRHRKLIKEAMSEDILIRRKRRVVSPESLGYQLCYDRRWKPSGNLRKLVLCEETAPAIIEELKRGLAFLQDGEIPEIADDGARNAWLSKWTAYADREGGCRKPPGTRRPAPLASQRVPRPHCGRTPRGIGNAPLPDVIEDKLIFFENEMRLI